MFSGISYFVHTFCNLVDLFYGHVGHWWCMTLLSHWATKLPARFPSQCCRKKKFAPTPTHGIPSVTSRLWLNSLQELFVCSFVCLFMGIVCVCVSVSVCGAGGADRVTQASGLPPCTAFYRNLADLQCQLLPLTGSISWTMQKMQKTGSHEGGGLLERA